MSQRKRRSQDCIVSYRISCEKCVCVCVKVSFCCFSISKIVQCIGDIGIGIAFFEAAGLRERDWECIRGLERSKVRR